MGDLRVALSKTNPINIAFVISHIDPFVITLIIRFIFDVYYRLACKY